MNMANSRWLTGHLAKALLAVVLLGGLAVVAGSSLAPQISPWQILAVAAMAGLALFGLIAVVLFITLTVRQFILRHGGTDVQWFWFGAEPPGLARLRDRARELKSERTKL